VRNPWRLTKGPLQQEENLRFGSVSHASHKFFRKESAQQAELGLRGKGNLCERGERVSTLFGTKAKRGRKGYHLQGLDRNQNTA